MDFDENEYATWSLGEIVDKMIRLCVKGQLSAEERKEYQALVSEVDRIGDIVRGADAEISDELG
ncbi:MAG: hypothetical protein NUW37_17240 [Planctomycetes bacterium]|nr:hypothetical protein [Planctomycetota bacterium]